MDARADPLRSWPIDNGINFSMVCVIVIILPTGCIPPVSKQCIFPNKLAKKIPLPPPRLRPAPGHAYRPPTPPVAAPPHPRRPHWRPPSRCTPPRCLPQAQCPPHPRTPSLPHTFATLPPPTHRPTPPRRRLTAPIPPDSVTRPALTLYQPCRTLHHPSLRNRHLPTHILTAQYHPTDASPTLYAARPLAQWANADRSIIATVRP